MAAITNLTNLTDVTTFYDLIVYDNNITGGLVGLLFIFVLFLILLMISVIKIYPDEFDKSLLAASFPTFGISLILISVGLVNFWYVLTSGLLFSGSALWVWINNRNQ